MQTEKLVVENYAASAILDFENSQFYWHVRYGGSSCITVPSFVKIGQTVFEISRFFQYSRWRSLPSWISEILKFYWLRGSGGSRCITAKFRQNLSIYCGVIEILRFYNMAVVRHLGFVCLEHIWIPLHSTPLTGRAIKPQCQGHIGGPIAQP